MKKKQLSSLWRPEHTGLLKIKTQVAERLMADISVKQYAEKLKISPERLLEQLEAAGIPCKDGIAHQMTDAHKQKLFEKLKIDHGDAEVVDGGVTQFTVTREKVSELNGTKIVRRKKRKFIRRTQPSDEPKTEVVEESAVAIDTPETVPSIDAVQTSDPAEMIEPVSQQPSIAEQNISETQEVVEQSETLDKVETEVLDKVETETSDKIETPDKVEKLAETEKSIDTTESQDSNLNTNIDEPKDSVKVVQTETIEANKPNQPVVAPRGLRIVSQPDENYKKQAESKKAAASEKKFTKENASKKTKSSKGSKKGRRDELDVSDDRGSKRRRGGKDKHKKQEVLTKHGFEKPTQPQVKDVVIPESITVSELAQKMSIKGVEVVKALMKMGVMATINQALDQDTAVLVCEDLGHKPTLQKIDSVEDQLNIEHEGDMVNRAPIVTIMGHVDHGKTSLLDYIRRTKVASGEAGGITQHIGAYSVKTDKGTVTFLDTPGHAAFSAMRARGAKCTDIVVLIVAADDGVKPQTIEAIQHAKAANVPMIVAINKVDKDGIDLDRVKTELSQHEVIGEDWGGDYMFVSVSAKTGQGIDDLLDAILLQAEVLELGAISNCPASGIIIESRIDKGRGAVATVLVQQGTLNKGDIVIAGTHYGRVRNMGSDCGKSILHAGPSVPVELIGLSGAPHAGDELTVVKDERKAREIALFRQSKNRELRLARQHASKLEGFMNRMETGDVKQLNILVKADVQGSVEALGDVLEQLSNEEVAVKVVSKGVGGLNESDVNLAMASQAIIIGFNVRADASARKLAAKEGISIYYYSIIYDIIDAIKSSIHGMIGPKFKEQIVGLAEVRDVFRSSKIGSIAGCMVIEGTMKRNLPIRVLRNEVVIYEGQLESLRRFKEDAKDVRSGMECGIGVKNYNDVKVGDVIEAFEKVEVKSELDL